MEYISGRDRNQRNLLPDCIEDYVEENNSVRVIDAYVDSLDMEALGFSRGRPNETGRPMYSPYDLLKLYLYGYMNRIRSSRRLEAETARNLEVIWLMNQLRPDHKTIARFRHDNPESLKRAFREFVKLCVRLGLYGRELIAIDGSKFKAVNSADRSFTEKKLKERMSAIDAKIEEYNQLMDEIDARENDVATEYTAEEIASVVAGLTRKKAEYEGYAHRLEESGETQLCVTNPESRLIKSNGKIEANYNVQAAVDSKNKLLVDFEVTNDVLDKNKLHMMTSRSAELLETEDLTAVADTGYDSATDIARCVMDGIDVHVAGVDITVCVPSNEPSQEITSQVNGRCVYFSERNIAICPMGHVMYPARYTREGKAAFHNFKACGKCVCRYTPRKYREFVIAMPAGQFRTLYDDSDLFLKQVRITPNQKLVKLRKTIVEHPFGTVKQAMDSRHCLTKGLRNVSGEFSLAFLAYNLKRVINILGTEKFLTALQM